MSSSVNTSNTYIQVLNVVGGLAVGSSLVIALLANNFGSLNQAFTNQKTVMSVMSAVGLAGLAVVCVAAVKKCLTVTEEDLKTRLELVLKRDTTNCVPLPDDVIETIFGYIGLKALFLSGTLQPDDPLIVKTQIEDFGGVEKVSAMVIKLGLIGCGVTIPAETRDPLERVFAWESLPLKQKHQVLGQIFKLDVRDKDVLAFTINYLLHKVPFNESEFDPEGLTDDNIDLIKFALENAIPGAETLTFYLPASYLRNYNAIDLVATHGTELQLLNLIDRKVYPRDELLAPIVGIVCLYGYRTSLKKLFDNLGEKILLLVNQPIFGALWNVSPLGCAIVGARVQVMDYDPKFKKGKYTEVVKLLLDSNADPSLLNEREKLFLNSGAIPHVRALLPVS